MQYFPLGQDDVFEMLATIESKNGSIDKVNMKIDYTPP